MEHPLFKFNIETFRTSYQEERPIILIFQHYLCENCEKFSNLVLLQDNVQEILFSKFIPIFLDIQKYPEIYERYSGFDEFYHTIHLASNNMLLTDCSDHSADRFLAKILQIVKEGVASEEITYNQPEYNPYRSNDDSNIFQDKMDMIAENTLSYILSQYDIQYGGWGGRNGLKYHLSSALDLLLLLFHRSRDVNLLERVIQTLFASINGLLDKKNGGFFFIANNDWSAPLIQRKTLLNNIAISKNFLTAYQVTKEPQFLKILQENLFYCFQAFWNPQYGLLKFGSLDTQIYEFYDPESNCNAACLLIDAVEILDRENTKDQSYFPKIMRILSALETRETKYGLPHNLINPAYNQYLLRDQTAYLEILVRAYSYTGHVTFLERAEHLAEILIHQYYDTQMTLFMDRVAFPGFDPAPLSKKNYPIHENSSIIESFTILYHLTTKNKWRNYANQCISSYYSNIGISPDNPFPPEFVIACQRFVESPIEIFLIGSKDAPILHKMLWEVKKIYDPFKIIQFLDPRIDVGLVNNKLSKVRLFEQPHAYIRVEDTFSPPAFSPEALARLVRTVLQAIELSSPSDR